MTTNPESQNAPGEQGAQVNGKNRWLVAAFVVVALVLVGILSYAILTSAGYLDTQGGAGFITITSPTQGSVLETTSPVSVTGHVGGLFEGGLVVQVLNAAGNVLVQQPTSIDSPEAGMGGEGTWSVELAIVAPPGAHGQIMAFSTSPADGSTIASAAVDVVFGDSLTGSEMVNLRDHLWMMASLNGHMSIDDTLITLHFKDFLVDGSGGCNLYSTSYERRSSNLNFGLVTSTAMDCETPPGIMKQEKTYFNALEQVTAYTISVQQLTMFDGTGSPILVFDGVVMGRVVALEGTQLPAEALVYISLYDVSQADAEARLIAEQVITDATEFPIEYAVKYDPQDISKVGIYAIQVLIEESSGNLLFTNPTAYYVISGDNPSQLDIIVEAVQ